MKDSKINVNFRFLKLNKLQAYTLKHEVMNASFVENCELDGFLGVVELSEFNIDEINDFYVRQQVAIEDCDIFAAITSPGNQMTVDVPNVVNRMLKYIDCKLTYSFTVA